MIVQCENCKTKFKLADEKITEKGLQVRCSKCKTVFTVKKEPKPQKDISSPISSQPPPPKPSAPQEEEFEEFSLSEDLDFSEPEPAKFSTERAPSTPAHQDYAFSDSFSDAGISEEKVGEEGEGGYEFGEPGDEEFGMDESASMISQEGPQDKSFSSEMPDIPEEEEDFDFVSKNEPLGQTDEFKLDTRPEIPVDEHPEEDFDFSEKLESYARTEKLEPKGDDLEAKLDTDTETEFPEPSALPSLKKEVPPPPSLRALGKEVEKPSRSWLVFLILVIVILGGFIGGGLAYFNSQGTFTFKDLTSGNFSKLKEVPQIVSLLSAIGLMEKPIKGEISILSPRAESITRADGTSILVISGKIQNNYPIAKSFIQVQANLYDKDRRVIASQKAYCDLSFSLSELQTMSRAEIEEWMDTPAGRTTANMDIEPQATRDFSIVFFDIPPEVEGWKVEVVSEEKGKQP